VETEKDGGLQSEPIENTDGVEAVAEEVKTTTEAPANDDVQKLEALSKLLSEKEKEADERASKKWQAINDRQVGEERRRVKEAERQAKLERANLEGLREVFLSGLDPEARAEAERRSAAKVAQIQAELNRPTPEQLAEVQAFQVKVNKANAMLTQLEAEFDIEFDSLAGKCSDPKIDMSTPDTAYATAKARLKELRNPKAEPKAEEPKAPKKAPRVDEGGSKSSGKREYTRQEISNMSPEERRKNMDDITKAYSEGRIK
jgi:hypothetical protein